ncbi:glycoside hydrolase family 61 protein [Exidia glandulosa HHB12029]|uniref:lytic cellulose monooxygenase (C4-dehydrogenating) n=1 Tax=Exidia glandulosa HHB12029 TaxID=1314781 RepID=A0A165CAS4_EXIGL|nr:glycoside hydrolase family 61 protein [Exidia glandulosa HHB12029]
MKLAAVPFFALVSGVFGHWCWPALDSTAEWTVVRKTDNFQTRNPIQNVTSPNFTCYNGNGGSATAPSTYTIAAGANVTFQTDNNMYHIGVLNVYMAKAPTTAAAFDGKGQVWFKIFQISGVADPTGTNYPEFPATGLYAATFPIPKNVPSGEYLLRTEYIALHDAYYFGGAQFYIGCAQIAVTGGGNGTPSPLVSIPGVYTGNEPGIIYDVYRDPKQTSYIQPGPAVWTG